MKKYLTLFCGLAVFSSPVFAQNNQGFYDNLISLDEIPDVKAEQSEADIAKQEARKLLEVRPQKLEIKNLPKQPKKITPKAKISEKSNLSEAPFGLMWGGTIQDIKNLGVSLTPITSKNTVNNFSATNLPKQISDFKDLTLSFGVENELYRIVSYGNAIEDTPDGALILKEYKNYYRLLEKKYGNAKQFYSQPDNQKQIGSEDFLKNIQDEKAFLYATFENKDIGVALSVNVDDDNKSYLIIDYTSLRILKKHEEKALDAL